MAGDGVRDSYDSVDSDAVLPLVYEELRQLAANYFRRQPLGHTLQPTALVHEAYLKLADRTQGAWNDKAHFVATAATAMRSILVDHARGRAAEKRGGGLRRITLDEQVSPMQAPDVDVLDLDAALTKLAALDARKSKVVELRFFGGLNIEETASALEVSHMTVSKDWRFARAWISQALQGGAS